MLLQRRPLPMLPPTAAIWTTGHTPGWVWKKTCRQEKPWCFASGPSLSIWPHRVFLRKPFAGTWTISGCRVLLGGEIIRDLNYNPALRKVAAQKLLRDVVGADGGPLIYNGSEDEQLSLDSTCRKLHRFLNQPQR
ncbi:MAG: hypothetical protein WA830_03340 [Candidatus Sulfotelmatobacter sp.]